VRLRAGTVEAALSPVARALPGGIGYLELPTSATGDPVAFVGQAERAIAAADATGTCGWVLDLRRNRGGDPFRLLAAAGPLLGEGDIGSFHFQSGDVDRLAYVDGEARLDGQARAAALGLPYRLRRLDLPVAVLTSRLTASAGEQVAVAFAGRPGTRRFGEPTRGIPTLNRGVDLPSGARLWVTTAVMVDRNGRRWDKALVPDQPAGTNWAGFAGAADPALSAATAWLADRPECG